MKTFPLRIGSPEGVFFEGEVQRIMCRGIQGELAVLAGHCNFCTALGTGRARVVFADGSFREAVCSGGLLSVLEGVCSVLAASWQWQENVREKQQ